MREEGLVNIVYIIVFTRTSFHLTSWGPAEGLAMELVYDKQLLYYSIIGLLNLQYVRSSSNSTFDESVASVQ